MVKTFQLLSAGTGFEDGVNFFTEFNEHSVNQGLDALTLVLPETCGCYCLRLHVENGMGCFRPFGNPRPPTGIVPPPKVPLEVLVENIWDWPLFRLGVGGADPERVREVPSEEARQFLKRLQWAAQIRLQEGSRFVGYFKIVGFELPLDERRLQVSFYNAKFHILSVLSNSILERIQLSSDFQQHLKTTLTAVLGTTSPIRALRHIADMLTSHLGVGWNRAACYYPCAPDSLECLWAQGGDGRDRWCEVQREVSKVTSADELIAKARSIERPADDQYSLVAAGSDRIRIHQVSEPSNGGILARLWRANGNVRQLDGDNQALVFGAPPFGDSVNRATSHAVAAVFGHGDPWVQAVERGRPGAPVFASRNQRYWAVPWFGGDNLLIGVWVLDMAYWGEPPDPLQIASMLSLTRSVLEVFAPAYQQVRINQTLA